MALGRTYFLELTRLIPVLGKGDPGAAKVIQVLGAQ
jgi:hypothetical protein